MNRKTRTRQAQEIVKALPSGNELKIRDTRAESRTVLARAGGGGQGEVAVP